MAGPVRALLVLLLGLAPGCGGDGGPLPFDRIVLVTFDTLRADHLGAYGYPVDTSPFLDALAERSVVFDRAYAAIPTTVPSHASMFTSLYPVQHRVFANGFELERSHATLAGLLTDAGFTTAGFVSTRAHFAAGGLTRGFVHFDEPAESKGHLPYRDASATVDTALRWLGGPDAGARFFLWVHLFDVHQPLRPPPAHKEAVAPKDESESRERLQYLRDVQHLDPGASRDGAPLFRRGARGLLNLHDRYDGEIHFADSQLARLFAGFESNGLAERTLWVVTSDHGEGLGNHGYKSHGRHVYEEQVRVPLLFFAEGSLLVPRRIAEIVEHVDLLPTLASVVGREAALAAWQPPVQGRSLWPLLQGQPATAGDVRSAFVQRRSYRSAKRSSPRTADEFEAGSKFALIEDRWKLIHHTAGDDELFDLGADPYETRNLAASQPERSAMMRAKLLARIRELEGAAGPEASAVDAATIERLEALGYVP